MTKVVSTIKDSANKAVPYVYGGAGVLLGSFGMKVIGAKLTPSLPAFIPEVVKKVTPGLLVLFLSLYFSTKTSNKNIEKLLLGIGFSGGGDAFLKLVGPYLPTSLTDKFPQLNGLGAQGAKAFNYGDYPPSYFMRNAFQGLKGRGMGNTAYALNGDLPYALNGRGMGNTNTAYALSGGAN